MRAIVAIAFGGLLAVAQQDSGLPPDLLLLVKTKVHAAETLDRLPNYTCVETIERSERTLPAKKFRLSDTVRLEVALVDGSEFFAWPGAKKFETKDLRDLVPSGTVGNGDFALFAKAVLQSNAPTYTYRGEVSIDGVGAYRWDFRVPVMTSGYQLKIGTQEGIAGFRGSFWVHASSLDLIRLELEAEDIPPNLDVSRTASRMDYARRKIGDSEFLLPIASDLTLVDLRGNEKRNRATFSDCRQYAGESVLRFDEAPAAEVTAPKMAPLVELPADLDIATQLTVSLDARRMVIGDQVRAILTENAKIRKKVVVPKGAVLTGRVIEVHEAPGIPYVTLQFTDLEWPEGRSVFTAVLESTGSPGMASGIVKTERGPAASPAPRPGCARFLFLSPPRVVNGVLVQWRTGKAGK